MQTDLDRAQLEAAGEDAEPAQQHPLVRLEQVVAPLERRLERLLPRRRRAAAGAEEPEAVVEPLGHRRGAERAEPPGGELDRERQAVEAEADARDVRRVLLVERESRRGRRRALDEQPHRLVVEEIGRRERLLRIGDRQRRHAEHDLAADAQRLAARREHRQPRRGPQDRVDERCARPEQVLAVVEDEQQRARREELDHRVDDVLSRQRPRVERRRDGVGHELRIGDRRELDERRAVLVRRLGAARELQREPRLARAARSRERQQARVPRAASAARRARARGRRTSSRRPAAASARHRSRARRARRSAPRRGPCRLGEISRWGGRGPTARSRARGPRQGRTPRSGSPPPDRQGARFVGPRRSRRAGRRP